MGGNMSKKALNILLDRTCETCSAQKTLSPDNNGIMKRFCRIYMGEACGWQWWKRDADNTCENWKK